MALDERAAAARAPRLAVVVLTWNGREDTLACLRSLHGQIGAEDAVVVCDNGSTDGTEAAVRAEHPWAVYLQNGANLGYAGGNNTGLRWALERGHRFVMLLNNDTTVPPGTLDALVAHADREPRVGAIQPLLVSAADPSRIDSAGHRLFRTPGAVDDLMGLPVAAAPAGPTAVFGACGAAAFLRADALRAAGLLDEAFFVLVEDVDLMFRIRLAGWDVQLVPALRVHHRRGISGRRQSPEAARRRRFWLQRNILALGLRYWPAAHLLASSPLLALRLVQALWLTTRLPGQRCLPLWRQSLGARRRNRARMRELRLDPWFRARLPVRAGVGPSDRPMDPKAMDAPA